MSLPPNRDRAVHFAPLTRSLQPLATRRRCALPSARSFSPTTRATPAPTFLPRATAARSRSSTAQGAVASRFAIRCVQSSTSIMYARRLSSTPLLHFGEFCFTSSWLLEQNFCTPSVIDPAQILGANVGVRWALPSGGLSSRQVVQNARQRLCTEPPTLLDHRARCRNPC